MKQTRRPGRPGRPGKPSNGGTAEAGGLRRFFVLLVFVCCGLIVLARAVYLQHYQNRLLQEEGDSRQVREVAIPAHRGPIVDRFNNPLAVSTPVYSVWLDPQHFDPAHINTVAAAAAVDTGALRARLKRANKRRFVYVRRHLSPHAASSLYAMNLPGLHLKVEYRRYYPTGEVAAHIVGTTDIDDKGLEGAEKVFDAVLRGRTGSKRVVRDRHGRVIKQVALLEPAHHGGKLELSIDQRIQYRAYRALKNAVVKHNAHSASIVVLDAGSGEILAIASQPSFNPNERGKYRPETRRNRALIDMFEPGSTVKPFVIAALVEGRHADVNTRINTSPGYYQVSGNEIKDIRDFGLLDLAGIVVKSSNVGISKAVMMMPGEELWNTFDQIGFGRLPGTGFPGETGGRLHDYVQWQRIDRAVMSYGYGIAVSLVQLAHAYTVFANDGWQPSLSFVKGNPHFEKTPVFSAATARYVRGMLRGVISTGGTGGSAKVKNYTTAGKTGTVRKYYLSADDQEPKYLSLFVGFVPADAPRFVAAVMIDTPSGGEYYGGAVAAPVFSEVMTQVLRLANVPNDEQPLGHFADARALKRVSR